jgi:hypothetical protein
LSLLTSKLGGDVQRYGEPGTIDRVSCDFAPGYPETMLDAATVYLNQSTSPHDAFQMAGSRRSVEENARALPRTLSVFKQPRLSTLPDQL